jgi:peptide/nickel transport system ATP-binding protein
MTGGQARARTLALLGEVGIPDPATKIDAYPGQMSGGQQQRVMIAMAIACAPRLLIADEPTTALDVTIQKQIMALIASLQKKHAMSVLFITHDLALVGEIADHVIVMRHGEVREAGPAAQLLSDPQDSYTRALLHCRPKLNERPIRLPVIEDYLQGRVPAAGQRRRGIEAGDAIVLEVKNLSKSFYLREGWFGQRCLVFARARQDAGRGGRIRFRQDDDGLDAAAAARGHGRHGPVRGARFDQHAGARVHGLQAAHPDHFPEPVCCAQSPLYGGAGAA